MRLDGSGAPPVRCGQLAAGSLHRRADRVPRHVAVGPVLAITDEGAVWTLDRGPVTRHLGEQVSIVGLEHLAQARQRWAVEEPAAYRYRLHIGCEFCPQLGEYDVEVHAGRITSVSRAPGWEHLEGVPDDPPTVADLLALAGQTEASGAWFDTRFGYPTFLSGSFETVYAVTNFEPLPG